MEFATYCTKQPGVDFCFANEWQSSRHNAMGVVYREWLVDMKVLLGAPSAP